LERIWIQEMKNCADFINRVVQGPVRAEAAGELDTRLETILSSATNVNNELIVAARSIELEGLASTIDKVVLAIADLVGADKSRTLTDGSAALTRLRYRLAGLVAEHDEWQWLNLQLTVAMSNRVVPPASRVPYWDNVARRIIDLCEVHPQEEWSGTIKEQLATVARDHASYKTEDDRTNENRMFLRFRRSCVDRFVDVDGELNELCAEIEKFRYPLEELLQSDP
jgi:hypothetical protein